MVRKTATTKKTTTPRKRTTPQPAVAKVAPAPKSMPVPEIATAGDAETVVVKALGKRELIDRVVEASGIKKKAAKPVVEAMLKELGDALSRGENLNLQPFGKGIVKARKDLENAEIVELRLRRSKLALRAAEQNETDEISSLLDPLAEAAE